MSLIDHCQTIPYFFFFNPYIKIELALYVFYDLWKETMNVFVILFYGFVYYNWQNEKYKFSKRKV